MKNQDIDELFHESNLSEDDLIAIINDDTNLHENNENFCSDFPLCDVKRCFEFAKNFKNHVM